MLFEVSQSKQKERTTLEIERKLITLSTGGLVSFPLVVMVLCLTQLLTAALSTTRAGNVFQLWSRLLQLTLTRRSRLNKLTDKKGLINTSQRNAVLTSKLADRDTHSYTSPGKKDRLVQWYCGKLLTLATKDVTKSSQSPWNGLLGVGVRRVTSGTRTYNLS
ncbi:serine/threonine-protein kinase Sgk3 [Platysternon megacephalum]|uniref:Serine/threonine-protein kinase Sgk3 n=1 Tax=Platysternon megacephalum TaxID=55544 RepID=A0A4D9F0S2_9SAUR|nr:serine/threonine-protein kinase Sgk3 [Platysternon megacephalum]